MNGSTTLYKYLHVAMATTTDRCTNLFQCIKCKKIILQIKPTWCTGTFIFVNLLSGMQGAPCIPDSHPHRITSTKCHINTIVSPDDGPMVTRNKQRLININILRKTVHKVGFIYKIIERCMVNET